MLKNIKCLRAGVFKHCCISLTSVNSEDQTIIFLQRARALSEHTLAKFAGTITTITIVCIDTTVTLEDI